MTRKFYKHKLLLDENVPNRTHFPTLNERFDLKHVVADYKQGSIPDEAVYELARKEKRLLVTYNIKDFIQLASKSTDMGIIGLSAQLSAEQIDTKLTALLRRNTLRRLAGKVTEITGETAF
jgi:predicted nuclease of predicted toxin-antitoxin system